jgi:hypothetical protein
MEGHKVCLGVVTGQERHRESQAVLRPLAGVAEWMGTKEDCREQEQGSKDTAVLGLAQRREQEEDQRSFAYREFQGLRLGSSGESWP